MSRLTIHGLIASDPLVDDIFLGAELGNVQDMNPRWELFIGLMMSREWRRLGRGPDLDEAFEAAAHERTVPAYLADPMNDPTVNVVGDMPKEPGESTRLAVMGGDGTVRVAGVTATPFKQTPETRRASFKLIQGGVQ